MPIMDTIPHWCVSIICNSYILRWGSWDQRTRAGTGLLIIDTLVPITGFEPVHPKVLVLEASAPANYARSAKNRHIATRLRRYSNLLTEFYYNVFKPLCLWPRGLYQSHHQRRYFSIWCRNIKPPYWWWELIARAPRGVEDNNNYIWLFFSFLNWWIKLPKCSLPRGATS